MNMDNLNVLNTSFSVMEDCISLWLHMLDESKSKMIQLVRCTGAYLKSCN